MSVTHPQSGIVVTLVPDDFHVAEILFEHRWPDGFVCRTCGGHRAVHLRCRPRVWECRTCRSQNSVTAGTSLHRARLPLGHILLAAVLQARPGAISANRLRQIIGCRYQTAWALLHRLRHAMLYQPEPPAAAASVTICGVRTRPHRLELPWRSGRVVRALGVRDANDRVRATISDRDIEVPTQALIDLHANPSSQSFIDQGATWLSPLRTQLERTHRRVSLRWLRRYVAAWAWMQGRTNRTRDLLRQLVRAPPAPWRDIEVAPLLLALNE